MIKIGLIVNPISGMGGSLGFKGTDGDIILKAIQQGAKPVSPGRVKEFLAEITDPQRYIFLTAPGKMGEEYLQGFPLAYEVIGNINTVTSATDTIRISQSMVDQGIDLLVFVGGDGTARNIYDAVGHLIPVIGIPAGVKIYSGVFAVQPRAAAELLSVFYENPNDLSDDEVLDIDEDAYRDNRLDAKLYGMLLVPRSKNLVQNSKEASSSSIPVQNNKEDIADWVIEQMDSDVLYLLGPGTTVDVIAEKMGVQKTLLGVDASYQGVTIGNDLNEREIVELLAKHPKVKIIITPIGGNGFIFGRGNKQFSPEIVRRVGKKNLIVVATDDKAWKLGKLRIDTGDQQTDELMRGYIEVVIGYKENRMMKVE